MLLIRKLWFRLAIVLVSIAGTSVLLALASSWLTLRVSALGALQSVALLFAVISALSLALYSNYIKGLRESYLKQVSNVRDLLEKFFDEHHDSEDPDVQEIIEKQIYPLLKFGHDQWLTYDEVKVLRGDIVEAATRLADRQAWFLPRHLLRIEDELNELGLLFIHRIITSVNTNIIRETFTLIVVGMISIALFHLLPDSPVINGTIVLLSTALIMWAAIQTLHLLSYFEQAALDEVGPLIAEEEDNDDSPTNT